MAADERPACSGKRLLKNAYPPRLLALSRKYIKTVRAWVPSVHPCCRTRRQRCVVIVWWLPCYSLVALCLGKLDVGIPGPLVAKAPKCRCMLIDDRDVCYCTQVVHEVLCLF